MISHLIGQNFLLRLVAVLEELLDHVVAKNICHQLDRIWVKLPKNLIFLITIGCFELLLDEARTVLITAELNYIVVDVLRRVSRV